MSGMLSGAATLTKCRQRRCALAIMPSDYSQNPMGTFPKTQPGIGPSGCSFAANRIAILKTDRLLRRWTASATMVLPTLAMPFEQVAQRLVLAKYRMSARRERRTLPLPGVG